MADAETGGEPAPAKQRRSCCGAIGRALWLVLCCVPRLVFYLPPHAGTTKSETKARCMTQTTKRYEQ